MSSKYKIAYLKNIFVFYVWIKMNSRIQDLLVSYSYDKIYVIRNATCHWRMGRIVLITLAGFELKQVPGRYSHLTQSSAQGLMLTECLRDLPQWPLSRSELSQERAWNGQELHHGLFCCGQSREQAEKWKKCWFLIFISFGELHITVGYDYRMETMQNARCKIGLRRLLTIVLWLWKMM